jgi:PAS domain S-box-containing protein
VAAERRILLLATAAAESSGFMARIEAVATALHASLTRCPDADQALAALQAAPAGRRATVLVIGPDWGKPFRLARGLAQAVPDTRFVFAVEPGQHAERSREAIYSGPAGGRWSLIRTDDPGLTDCIAAELAADAQQQRLRTTLDRMKVRLPTPAPIDGGEYRRLVASDRYLASVLRHAHDAIVSIDPAGRVVSWNQGADHLFGMNMEQARRSRLQNLFSDREAAAEAIGAALSGSFRMTGLEIERDGAQRHVEANFGVLRDDAQTTIGAVAILRDVTERFRAEQELRESSRQKDEFLAMLAHELRNPLAPIRNAVQLLSQIGQDDPRARRAVDVIGRQSGHMSALISDLLDVARVTRGAIVLEREVIAIEVIVRDAIEQARGLMRSRQQDFGVDQPDAPLHVHGDRKRLTQVLANLLINAAKYTPEQGRIRLGWRGDGGHVVVTVSDNGIGMDAALRSRVFDLFVQAERSPDRADGGLGLGLALVRSLVSMHGGSVSAHSDGPGCGSTFSLRLPRVGAEAVVDVAPAPSTEHGGRALRLVVVDDNEDAAHTLGILLRESGHRVDVQVDPRSALEQAARSLPDAFIVDIGMPHIDGYEFARRIRDLPGGSLAALIALTGYGHASDVERAHQAGFDHHLVKPLQPDLLAAILVRLASR